MKKPWSASFTGLAFCFFAWLARAPGAPPADWRPEPIAEQALPNAFRVHERVISGGEPADEAAFIALQALGVRTIISVDGARPNVELARLHGMRYVHLPHGYDGVPSERVKELAKAVRDLTGPIYVHCHHGKHRSPAATAVACVAAGLLEPQQALAVLKTAGTSVNYRGLYQSAASVRRIDDSVLAEVSSDFPAIAKVPPMADAMVQIEHTHDHLRALAEARWRRLSAKPDLDPAHEALLLKEHYRELARTPDATRQPDAFRRLLNAAEQNAERLETALREKRTEAATAALATATQDCTKCHQRFRDVPLGEKTK